MTNLVASRVCVVVTIAALVLAFSGAAIVALVLEGIVAVVCIVGITQIVRSWRG